MRSSDVRSSDLPAFSERWNNTPCSSVTGEATEVARSPSVPVPRSPGPSVFLQRPLGIERRDEEWEPRRKLLFPGSRRGQKGERERERERERTERDDE